MNYQSIPLTQVPGFHWKIRIILCIMHAVSHYAAAHMSAADKERPVRRTTDLKSAKNAVITHEFRVLAIRRIEPAYMGRGQP